MKKPDADFLVTRLRKKTEKATSAFLEEEDGLSDREWIERATLLLRARSLSEPGVPAYRRQLVPLVLTVLCLVTPLILWSIPIGDPYITISLRTTAVNLSLGQPWELPRDASVFGERISVEGVTTLSSPELGIDVDDPDGDLIVTAFSDVSVRVQRLTLSPLSEVTSEQRGRVEFRGGEKDFILRSRGNSAAGELSAAVPALVSYGLPDRSPTTREAEAEDLSVTILVRTEPEGISPMSVSLTPEGRVTLDGFHPLSMSFNIEDSDTTFGTAVRGGTVRVHSAPMREVRLEEGDSVRIAGDIVTEIIRLEHDDELHFVFRGTVGEVEVGAPGHERSLAPNLLENIYHQRPVGAFMGLFALLSVLLLSIPRLLVR